MQIAPSYNSEWGFEDGAQNDIFVEASSDSSSSASASTASKSSPGNAAPLEAVQNRVVVVNAADQQSKTLSAADADKEVLTGTIVATRVHYATITAQAENLKLAERDVKIPLPVPQMHKARMVQIKRAASPHQRLNMKL